MANVFQQPSQSAGGPQITPATMSSAAQGGQQNPGFLQMRRPTKPPVMGGMTPTAPVITPKPTVQGDTIAPQQSATQPTPMPQQNPQSGPPITPAKPGLPPQAGGNNLGDVYKFFASDLENQTKQAKSNATADASARGVYYGTPLTGSEADIDTQYLRGLGQLQAGMYGNEQSNQLARLGMATNLSAQGNATAPPTPGAMDWSGLGALFGGTNSPSSPSNGPARPGPVISPQSNDKNKPKPTNSN